jgi:hypothetical protein
MNGATPHPAPEGLTRLAQRFSAGTTDQTIQVPEGRPNLAQRFSAGEMDKAAEVPEGRLTGLFVKNGLREAHRNASRR